VLSAAMHGVATLSVCKRVAPGANNDVIARQIVEVTLTGLQHGALNSVAASAATRQREAGLLCRKNSSRGGFQLVVMMQRSRDGRQRPMGAGKRCSVSVARRVASTGSPTPKADGSFTVVRDIDSPKIDRRCPIVGQ
jgi:hypothetical protein